MPARKRRSSPWIVVIVELPAKAKTINKYLGPGYEVLASYGHVRDLPSKDGSVRPDDDFSMDWEVDAKSKKRLSDIADAVKDADRVILATDPDREGEAISWHVLQVLTRQEGAARQARRARRLQRRDQAGRAGGDAPSARDRRAAGRRLSGAPRARLSRRLHALAGAVAQAAGRPLGRPRPVGRAAPRLRPRSGDRALPARRNTGRSWRRSGRRATTASPPASSALDGRKLDRLSIGNDGEANAHQAARSKRRLHGRRQRRSEAAEAQSAAALHHLDPAAGSAAQARLRRQPHDADRPAALRGRRDRRRDRSASSPTCGPTASTSRRRRWPPRAA